MNALYRPGDSLLHRAPAGAKVATLAVAMSLLVVFRSVPSVAVGAVVLLVAYAVARVPVGAAWAVVRPLRWLVGLVVVFQVLVADVTAAVVVAGTIVVAVLGAGLVTLTTRMTALLDTFVRVLGPLRRIGVDPDRVGLLMALTMRCVPVLGDVGRQVREARRARGAERSARALVVPMVQRTIRQADQLGEALAARGVDD